MFPCIYHIVRKYLSQCINILPQNNKRILILTVEQNFFPSFEGKIRFLKWWKLRGGGCNEMILGVPNNIQSINRNDILSTCTFHWPFSVYANPVILYRPFYDINLILLFMWAMLPIGLYLSDRLPRVCWVENHSLFMRLICIYGAAGIRTNDFPFFKANELSPRNIIIIIIFRMLFNKNLFHCSYFMNY